MAAVLLLLVLSVIPGRVPAHAQVSRGAHQTAPQSQRPNYVGDAACMQCHKELSVSYSATAHHLASQVANRSTVLGSFATGRNVLNISGAGASSTDPKLTFVMEANTAGLYQSAVAELDTKRLTRMERFDIVFGSGVRGQTYLYWNDNHLFELPVSYWTEGHQWINSPGYRDGTANFARHVDARCVECHASYIQSLSEDPQANVYVRASFVPGIGCETCHGPGAMHIAGARNPQKQRDGIVSADIFNPAKFDRDQKVDQCALCHNGTTREELAPAFSYLPGARLDRYLAPLPLDPNDRPDVHGNQVGLLKRSKCYLGSKTMSCSTCHAVHASERPAASYSPVCLSCHQWQSCGVSRQMGERITGNCVDCHMPVQQTDSIVSVTAGTAVRASIRTHWIKVYPASSKADEGKQEKSLAGTSAPDR